MLRIAAGLIDPDRGRAQVWGVDRRARTASATSAWSRSCPPATAASMPASPSAASSSSGRGSRWSPREQVRRTGRARRSTPSTCGELAERRVDRMSMGQRQRLRIAMTFLTEPGDRAARRAADQPRRRGADDPRPGDRASCSARGGALLWCSPSGERLDREFDARWRARRRQAGAGMNRLRSPLGSAFVAVLRRDLQVYLSYRTRLVSQVADLALQPDALLLRLAPGPRQRLRLPRRLLRLRRRRHLPGRRPLLLLLDRRTGPPGARRRAPSNGCCSRPSARSAASSR